MIWVWCSRREERRSCGQNGQKGPRQSYNGTGGYVYRVRVLPRRREREPGPLMNRNIMEQLFMTVGVQVHTFSIVKTREFMV